MQRTLLQFLFIRILLLLLSREDTIIIIIVAADIDIIIIIRTIMGQEMALGMASKMFLSRSEAIQSR